MSQISALDVIILAPLATLFGLVLIWFIQLLFIESQKYLLNTLNKRYEALIRFTNFIGIFFQTFCQALGYTVTRKGISRYYLSVNYGQVDPKREKSGLFEWVSNGFLFLGPFFIPSLVLLVCSLFLIPEGLVFTVNSTYTFSANLIAFSTNLYVFSSNLFIFLLSIDLLHPVHVGFFLLLVMLGLGIRPSYIDNKSFKKLSMFYDLKNIKDNLLTHPLYIVMFLLLFYCFSYISVLFNGNWYVSLCSIFGWAAIIAIIALIIAHGLLFLIRISDELPDGMRFIPFIMAVVAYLGFRVIFYFFSIPYMHTVTLLIMFVSLSISEIVLLSKFTNKFKTKKKMKSKKGVLR